MVKIVDSEARWLLLSSLEVNNVLEYTERGDKEYQAPELGVSIDVERLLSCQIRGTRVGSDGIGIVNDDK